MIIDEFLNATYMWQEEGWISDFFLIQTRT
jgi:hypothetical protein